MRWRHLICPTLVLLTLAVYWQTLGFDFVNLDDHTYVAKFPRIWNGLTYDNVVWTFTTTYFSNWHPLTWLSYMLDAQLFGIDAGRFHATNVAWHTANVLLLFVILKQLTRATWRSAFVAAVFAVHPLHVESVAWISERKDVLATFFGLLAIGAYGRYCRKPSRRWYLMSLAAFALSLMSKQTLVTLPFLLLVLDYWPLGRVKPLDVNADGHEEVVGRNPGRSPDETLEPAVHPRPWRSLVLEKTPFFVLAALFAVVALWCQQRTGATEMLHDLSLTTRCLNAVLVYGIYIDKTIWPVDLAAFYPYPDKQDLVSLRVVVTALLLTLLTAAVLWERRRRPFLVVGWLWYVGTLVPVIGIVQIGRQQWADRYSYFSMVGLLIGITWLVPTLLPRGLWRRVLLPGAAISIVVALTAAARVQTAYWRNSTALFARALDVTENNSVAYHHLGNVLYNQGRIPEAIEHYHQAIRINPLEVKAHRTLGRALRKQGQVAEAVKHFRRAIDLAPDFAEAHFRLGNLFYEQKQFAEAIRCFHQALSLDPGSAEANNNLGNVYLVQKRFAKATSYYRQALALNPDHATAHFNLGNALCEQKRYSEAIDHFRQSIRVNPLDFQAHHNLGDAYYNLQQSSEAIRHFQHAVNIDGRFWPARLMLGRLFLEQGDRESAINHLRDVLKIQPDSEEAQELLSRALDN